MTDRSTSDNEIVFETDSTCPLLKGSKIRLYQNTWSLHIATEHFANVERANTLAEIQKVAERPDLLADSKPGPGNIYAGNLVIARNDITYGTSKLHVYLEPDGVDYNISSAWPNKGYHGLVRWRASDKTEDGDA